MGSLGGLSPGGSVALGIVVGILSTSVQSLGITLQRKSHILEDEKGPHDVHRPAHRRRRWQLGMAMFIIANVLGSTVQISTLPLPVLSTLQASGLVFNSICATLILSEPFTRWSMWGTLLVCSGAILIAIFGAIPAPAHNLAELLELFGKKPFIIWMSLTAVVVVAIGVTVEVVNRVSKFAQDPRFCLVRGLAYGCISGVLSAHSLLVAKLAVELLVRTIADKHNEFNRWQSWALLGLLISLALSQLYYLHRGLKLVSTSVLYPLCFCIYNIIAILDGLIYFRQVDQLGALSAGLISLGTVILLSGVLALSWRLSDEQHSPGPGQSTLAPGLGLVEDTDGEEEEEELLLASDIAADEESALPRQYSYQTFGGENGGTAAGKQPAPSTPNRRVSMAPSIKPASSRRAERAEIWDELDDQQDNPGSPLIPRTATRRRSSTLPIRRETIGGSGLPTRRTASGGGDPFGIGTSQAASASAEGLPILRPGRRRRKSMGFPGFHARRTRRKSSTGGPGLQDAIGGFFGRLGWGKDRGKNAAPPELDYRDEPEYRDDPLPQSPALPQRGEDSGTRAPRGRREDESPV